MGVTATADVSVDNATGGVVGDRSIAVVGSSATTKASRNKPPALMLANNVKTTPVCCENNTIESFNS